MSLNEVQKDMLAGIARDQRLFAHFHRLCALMSAVVKMNADDPGKTGRFARLSLADPCATESAERGTQPIALAWIEAIRQAAAAGGGRLASTAFDADRLPVTPADLKPLFAAADTRGLSVGQMRSVFRRESELAHLMRGCAMKILVGLGRIRPGKRARNTDGRFRELTPKLARHLDPGEIARAKAGSVYYSLIETGDGYHAVRVRKTSRFCPLAGAGSGGEPAEMVGCGEIDALEFRIADPAGRRTGRTAAVVLFAAFLATPVEGRRITHQCIVHLPDAEAPIEDRDTPENSLRPAV